MEVKIFIGLVPILSMDLTNKFFQIIMRKKLNYVNGPTKWIFLILLIINACAMGNDKNDLEKIKREILDTEKAFASMAKRDGVAKAFLNYAAEDAVLNRNDILIKGKTAIKSYFENQTLRDVNLNWTPDFVSVSKSGDLAYTYGHYTFSATNPTGENISAKGIFHTVWKRQKDGLWKFVWD